MLKYGNICEVNYSKGLARVNFDESGIVSGWLSLPTSSTKSKKHFIPLEVNTQVAVLMHPDGEQGEIIKACWSSQDVPPSWANKDTEGIEYPDGTNITYNTLTHTLDVELCKGGKFKVNGDNQALKAIIDILTGPSIPEAGNGANSSLQLTLQTALQNKSQNIWENE